MNSITPFNYDGHDVRVVERHGEPWFVAADLCSVLDIRNSRDALARLDPDEKGVVNADTPGGTQQMSVVNEAGMYSLVLTSRKPEAKTFKRWVTHEVLPSIRKRGGYLTPEATEAALSDPDFIIRLATDLKTERARRTELEAKAAVDAPKVHAWDGLVSGAGDYTITDAAKVLTRAGIETGPRKLHGQLLELGWVFKNQRDKWVARQERLNDGCLAEKIRYYVDDDGVSTLATPQVRITAKGMEKLRAALSSQPVLAEAVTS